MALQRVRYHHSRLHGSVTGAIYNDMALCVVPDRPKQKVLYMHVGVIAGSILGVAER